MTDKQASNDQSELIFDSSSSSEKSRATSPASSSDNGSDNIGCIPEEVEEELDNDVKLGTVNNLEVNAEEVKDDEINDGQVLETDVKDDKVEDDVKDDMVDNDVTDKKVEDDVTDSKVEDDVKDNKFEDDVTDNKVEDDVKEGGVEENDARDEDVKADPRSISTYSSRPDMDLLKAILHDESAGDDVIPEEAEESSDVDDKVKKLNGAKHFEATTNDDTNGNCSPTPSDSKNAQVSANTNGINNEEVDEADRRPETEQSGAEAEQEPAAGETDKSTAEPTGKKRRKKQTQKKKKKLLGPPVPPWSRASINSFSRPAQQQPLASDRSTSVATGSIGGGSRGSRALSMSAKEMREKYRPVSNEEKMAQRLSEIDSLLARDYANEARLAYQRSVAECRQAWQNFASTARIMGHVTDQADEPHSQGRQSNRAHPRIEFSNDFVIEEEEAAAASSRRRTHPFGGRVAPELGPAPASHPQPHRRRMVETSDETDNRKKESEQENDLPHDQELSESQHIQQPTEPADNGHQYQQQQQQHQQQLHGYRVGAPQRMAGRFGSDHKLSESDNPDVRAWLREKNRAERRQRREARDAKRREMQARLDAQQRQSERRQEAEEAFQSWSNKKKRDLQLQAKTDKDGKSASAENKGGHGQRQASAQEPLPLADQEAAFAALENRPRQGGPRPPGSAKPVHNSVFKRSPAILGSAGASFSGRQVRMGIIGQPVKSEAAPVNHSQLAIEHQKQQAEVRLSYDEWSQRKAEQLAAKRRQERDAERQRKEAAAAAADPELSALVPQLARRRIQMATELKQRRTDTGLGLARPRTAVPALAPTSANSAGAASRRRQASARVASSSRERREAAISSELPNPFVAPAEDAMLEQILSAA